MSARAHSPPLEKSLPKGKLTLSLAATYCVEASASAVPGGTPVKPVI